MHLFFLVTRLDTQVDQKVLFGGEKGWVGVDQPEVTVMRECIPVFLNELQQDGGFRRGGRGAIEAWVILGL